MVNKSNEQLEELALLHELRKRQLASVLSQQQLLSAQILEHQQAKQAIESFSKKKEGDEILVPLGASIYTFTKISKVKQILTGIGADLSIEKTPEGAIKALDERIKNLNEESRKLSQITQQIKAEVDKIASGIEAVYRKKKE
jgi:prefoldin alpha subunit